MIQKRIFLIGHMGAGKSEVSKKLASQLGWQAMDADEILVRSGKGLVRIMEERGQSEFRKLESEVLRQLLKQQLVVVATGGGVILAEQNRQLLKQEFVVFLQVSVAVQLQRNLETEWRPILHVDDKESVLKKLHQERDGLYEQVADVTINTCDKSVDDVVSEIIVAIR